MNFDFDFASVNVSDGTEQRWRKGTLSHHLIILTLLITACSEPSRFAGTDAAFTPYILEFESRAKTITFFNVKFISDTSKAGSCDLDNKSIYINREFWSTACDEQRRAIIFHELGHCVLGRYHATEVVSYMYPGTLFCSFYINNKDELLKELFG